MREKKGRAISDRFFREFDLARISVVHSYLPIPRFYEVATSSVLGEIWSKYPHIKTAAPRINVENGELESVIFGPDSEFIENKWGIREPAGHSYIEPSMIDLVIVPLLCCDMLGNRVGYGKGFYDRFLARCRHDCLKIGFCVFVPIDRNDDIHDGDVRLNVCVTPNETFYFDPISERR